MAQSEQSPLATPQTVKILIVDDEVSIRRGLTIALQSEEREIKTAKDGLEAYKIAIQEDFDLILADISMPHMSGLDLTRKLRKEGYRKPIVLCSAHFGDEAHALADEDPKISLLEKPMTLQDIRSMVGSLL